MADQRNAQILQSSLVETIKTMSLPLEQELAAYARQARAARLLAVIAALAPGAAAMTIVPFHAWTMSPYLNPFRLWRLAEAPGRLQLGQGLTFL